MLRSACLALFLVALPCTFTNAADDRPNIVIILCDDLGFGDLGIHGHPHIQTPFIDSLADEGLRFTSFYSTAPVCSPSRVGLLTGRSPNRAGVYDWIPEARTPRPDAREQVHMKKDEVTIAQLLKKGGYATCMAGKWHCNAAFNSPDQPQPGDAGFDHWMATQNNAAPSHQDPVNYVRNGKPVGKIEGFSCQIATDEATGWMAQHVKNNPEQPFFIYLPFHEPHEPVASPPALVKQYESVTWHPDQAQYYANVHNVDLAVGKVVKALENAGVRDNTLIVFTADNGPETLNRYRSANRSWGITAHLRGMKLHTHDGGFHVAGIFNWPKGIKPGQVTDTVGSALDLLPTACDLAGVDLPAERKLDGISLKPLFESGTMNTPARSLVWAYYNGINDARVAMRHGQWKVLARLNGGNFPKRQNLTPTTLAEAKAAKLTDFEIYNIDTDPGEISNLAGRGVAEETQLIKQIKTGYAELVDDSPAWTPVTKSK
ncbi:sulfatase family protein [Fuerstiella marisgermanici]|uniref:Arylsulfatase n=1 Tax=Fuerstiella marisgermanici TaxID=1891926 RepID=A0A1P8WPI9_9PLAN|nr:sulfatase-like hydrolase/transferase [Fuerstiella marisgermanici]APZ95963.1 Arylsulfatase [Fuerstiella marisgermanici]